jgi:hypothetical protein
MRKITISVLIILLIVNFIYVVSGALNYSLRSIDVYAIWLYKAKLFYVNEGRIFSTLRGMTYGHPKYPILLPFLYYLIYRMVGGVKEMYVFLLYPLIYSGILFLIYYLFRKLDLDIVFALLFTYIYSMFGPLLAQGGRNHAGTADIVITLVNWVIVIFTLIIFKDKEKHRLDGLFIALLVALNSMIKSEGVFYSAILLFLPGEKKRKILWFLVAITPTLIWRYLIMINHISYDYTYYFPGLIEFLQRGFSALYYVGREMLNYRNWYIFWPVFFIVFILIKKEREYIRKVLYPSALLFFFTFIAVYIFTREVDPADYVPPSIDRILFQLSPFYYPIFVLKTAEALSRETLNTLLKLIDLNKKLVIFTR